MKIKYSKITLLVCSFLVMVMFSILLNIKPDRAEQTTTSRAPIDTISIKKTIFDSLLKRFCEGSITQAYTTSQTNEGYAVTFNYVKSQDKLFDQGFEKLFLEPNIVKNGFYVTDLGSNKVNIQLVMLEKMDM